MGDGELAAVFRSLAEQAGETAKNIANSVGKLTEKTAEIEERNLATAAEADARAAEAITAAGRTTAPVHDAQGAATGPPWPAVNDVTGPAHGKELRPPNSRHTVSGSRSAPAKEKNTVALRGNEAVFRADVQQIAAGQATWDEVAEQYVINGRGYGVKANGTTFPTSGPGLANLDRVEYAALQQLVKAGGDPGLVRAFQFDPKFIEHPEAIAKAKAIYDGTYSR